MSETKATTSERAQIEQIWRQALRLPESSMLAASEAEWTFMVALLRAASPNQSEGEGQ